MSEMRGVSKEGEVFHQASLCSSHGEAQILSTCYSMYTSPAIASANLLNKTPSLGSQAQFTGCFKINNNHFLNIVRINISNIHNEKACCTLYWPLVLFNLSGVSFFRRVHTVAKNEYWLRHFCVFPFVSPSAWNISTPTGRILIKFDI